MTSIEWVHSQQEVLKFPRSLKGEEVSDHPLKPLVVSVTESKIQRKLGGSTTASSTGSSTPSKTPTQTLFDPLGATLEGVDPLSQFAKKDNDPLTRMTLEEWDSPTHESKKNGFPYDETFESWSSRKSGILSKFTTSEKLTMVTSFLSGGEKVVVKAQSAVVDKVKTRLEQLDEFEEGSVRQMLNLTQQEYVSRIELLNHELVQAWNEDQRVKALKIAIQCSKLLVDVSVIQFYPSKFVLITDTLDTFGKLVYDRLRKKAEYVKPGTNVQTLLPENFTPDMVPESAKETCRNWFYKIASIRELVPRIYCEMAILKSYSYLTTDEFTSALLRLTKMIRGIGDPLVAIYARCYLCRVGLTIAKDNDRSYVRENFYDFISTYRQLFSRGVSTELKQQNIDSSVYLTLYTPALDWILQCMAHNAPETLLVEVLAKCQEVVKSALLLNSIMAAFKPSFIASRALLFTDLVTRCANDQCYPQYLLFRTLGLCVSLSDPPQDQRLQVLNDVWKVVTRLDKPEEYISCAEVWITFVVKHFTLREVNTFLGDIIRHMTPERSYERHYSSLQTIIEKVINNSNNFVKIESLFTLEKFLPLLDLFQKENIKVEVCKTIMNKFIKTNNNETTNDPVITNSLMFICRVMHDSVDAMTVEDEKKQISNLISSFINSVDYGRDFEQQLNFYVETRVTFINLDQVHAQLVESVNRLAVETRRAVKGYHTRKTAAFVRACSAYCFITVPSITSVFTKLDLYLLSGQVALMNQCLGQADACFKTALSLIPDVPKFMEVDGKQRSSEQYLVSYLCSFLSTLVVVPDNPDQGVLYLLRGLVNVVQSYPWDQSSTSKSVIYLNVLDTLNVLVQETYPYHVDKVDSNDTLYGSDPKFVSEINKMSTIILNEILNQLKLLSNKEQYIKQSNVALGLFLRIMLKGDLNQNDLANLAVNLWTLSQKHGAFDSKLLLRTKEYLTRRSYNINHPHPDAYSSILQKLQLLRI